MEITINQVKHLAEILKIGKYKTPRKKHKRPMQLFFDAMTSVKEHEVKLAVATDSITQSCSVSYGTAKEFVLKVDDLFQSNCGGNAYSRFQVEHKQIQSAIDWEVGE